MLNLNFNTYLKIRIGKISHRKNSDRYVSMTSYIDVSNFVEDNNQENTLNIHYITINTKKYEIRSERERV